VTYAVKEIYATLQGEGAQTGRPAVFLRFAGCNLWSGREADRAGAICRFCDTDFVGVNGPGGGRFTTAADLADTVASVWRCSTPAGATASRFPLLASRVAGTPFVVCTGGEPLLQLDLPLVDALHAVGFEIAIETNGTMPAPAGIDWICVSPKANAPLILTTGDELKLVYPQEGAEPERYEALPFRHFSLQPMDGPERERNTELALQYCAEHPRWRLSLQTHKLLGLR
jgi:7-carboxy-7-deazaguanine synthase